MTSASIDRRFGLTGNKAYKAPCDVATTGNITLSGEQTIDGVLTSESDVLVWQQSNPVDNGIWVSSTGSWTRRADANTNQDLGKGTQVYVSGGTAYAGNRFAITANDPINPGTTSITIAQTTDSSTLEARLASTASAADGAVLVGIHDAAERFQSADVEKALAELDTKQSKSVFWYIPMALWPAITDGTGTTDIAPYINDAFTAMNAAGGIAELTFGPYRFRCDTVLSCISSLTGADKLNKRRLLQGRGAIIDFRNGSWSADYTADAQIELFHFGCAPNTSSPGNPLTIIENGMAAIRDFVILGNEAQRPNTPSALTKPTTGTIGLRLRLAHDVQVENVLIENCTVGFETKDSWGLHMNSVRSRNCWIGLQANGGSTTAKWTNCFAVQCAYGVIVRTSLKSAAPYYGAYAGCSQQLFEGTRIEDCWYEYILYPHDTDIVGCHIVGGYSETSYGRDAIVAGFGFNQALLHDPASTLSSATTPTVDRLTVNRLGKMQFGGGFYALRTPSGGSANLKHSRITLPVLRASVSGDMRSTILECIGQSSDGGGTVYYCDASGNDFIQLDMSTVGGKVLAYQLDLRDGVAAPTAISGRAITYVDTADGDLKVRFGDAVTKTLATDT